MLVLNWGTEINIPNIKVYLLIVFHLHISKLFSSVSSWEILQYLSPRSVWNQISDTKQTTIYTWSFCISHLRADLDSLFVSCLKITCNKLKQLLWLYCKGGDWSQNLTDSVFNVSFHPGPHINLTIGFLIWRQ